MDNFEFLHRLLGQHLSQSVVTEADNLRGIRQLVNTISVTTFSA